ncbi:MAG TPA: glycosyltransferase family 2 protein [Pirellulaceae bacterium]|jgi:glycosyltransferase involved in cell wall biosynthesis|nr:glycosyltransferase family 2 protein [Pirellulaceae bacterium]
MDSLSRSEATRLLSNLVSAGDSLSSGSAEPFSPLAAHPTREQVALLESLLGTELCRRLGIVAPPADFLLSIVIPIYNESRTIESVVERVRRAEPDAEIILVDDGSHDGTRDKLAALEAAGCRVILHERNQGKGAALMTGFAAATGDVVAIQDADREYDPLEFRWLLQPIFRGEADVVYGSRFSSNDRLVTPWWHRMGNQVITTLFNLRSGQSFTDVETCYKLMRREALLPLLPTLQERRFGIEIELTMKLVRTEARFAERPIRYDKRTYAEGKKIGLKDAFRAVWCMLKY